MAFEEERAIVQDDRRQSQIAEICGLQLSKKRDGPDAYDEWGNSYELKSTTKIAVTTARDVGSHTVAFWRTKYWVIAKGINYPTRFEIEVLYILHPTDLEPFFSKIEERLAAKIAPWEKVLAVLAAAEQHGVDPRDIELCREIIRRGITLNNPKIPIALIRQRAVLLDPRHPEEVQKKLRQFVQERPLLQGPTTAADRIPTLDHETI